MQLGDRVRVPAWDDAIGTISGTRVDKYSKLLTFGVTTEEGRTRWFTAPQLVPHDPATWPPPLESDLKQASTAVATHDLVTAAEVSRRLARSKDDRALAALLELVPLEASDGTSPAGVALENSVHPNPEPVVLARVESWRTSGKNDSAILWALRALAPRRPPGLLPLAVELGARAADDRARLLCLAVRLMLGDAEGPALLLAWVREHESAALVKTLINRTPETAAALLPPLVRSYQEGDESLAAVAKAIENAVTPVYEHEADRTFLNRPPLAPVWFELGLDLFLARPRRELRFLAKNLLEIGHPERRVRADAARQRFPQSRSLAAIGSHPLGLNPEIVERYRLQDHLLERCGRWWLVTKYQEPFNPTLLDQILADLHLPGLGLAFGGRVDRDALLSWSSLSSFVALDLSEQHLKAAGVKDLLACKYLSQVEELDLSGCDIGLNGLKAIASSDVLPALRSLKLGVGDADRTKWDDKCLQALLSGTGASLAQVRSLDLTGWSLRKSVRQLAESSLGRRLTALSLNGQCSLGSGGLELLHRTAVAGGVLEELDLSGVFRNSHDGCGDWNALRGEPVVPLRTLRSLKLDDCAFETRHTQALVEAWFWRQLRALSFGGDQELDPLAQAPAGLEHLVLCGQTKLDDARLLALSTWPVIARLSTLELRGTPVTGRVLDRLPAGLRAAVIAGGWPD